jgi:hypothetical protein
MAAVTEATLVFVIISMMFFLSFEKSSLSFLCRESNSNKAALCSSCFNFISVICFFSISVREAWLCSWDAFISLVWADELVRVMSSSIFMLAL